MRQFQGKIAYLAVVVCYSVGSAKSVGSSWLVQIQAQAQFPKRLYRKLPEGKATLRIRDFPQS